MANFNKVILMGNLTRDPQLSYLPSQTPVVEIGLAVNRTWKGQEGQKNEDTCFVDCKAFGKQAEVLNQYMTKGRPILIEGRLDFSSWEGKDGQKRSKLRVVIENFQFIGSASSGGGGGGGGGGGYRSQPAAGGGQDKFGQAAPQQSSSDHEDAGEPAPPDMGGSQGGDNIPF